MRILENRGNWYKEMKRKMIEICILSDMKS